MKKLQFFCIWILGLLCISCNSGAYPPIEWVTKGSVIYSESEIFIKVGESSLVTAFYVGGSISPFPINVNFFIQESGIANVSPDSWDDPSWGVSYPLTINGVESGITSLYSDNGNESVVIHVIP